MNCTGLPPCWKDRLQAELNSDWFAELSQFVAEERKTETVFPPEDEVFNAFRMTPYNDTKVLILGQDPYHDDNQAHGLCFSVRPGIKVPPSLRNIYKELNSDLQIETPADGCLTSWANQGVLLLNTVLTVRAHKANSHRKQGWEKFTTRVIECVNELPSVAFVLWGKPAQTKAKLIDSSRHLIIESPHPSPLSAHRGFFGTRPFSMINKFLREKQLPEIDWQPGETSCC